MHRNDISKALFITACACVVAACKQSASPPAQSSTITSTVPSITPSPSVPVVTTVSTTVASSAPAAPSTDATPAVTESCDASVERGAFKRTSRGMNNQPRIVGGTASTLPFAVAITSNGAQSGQYCGGSLIGRDTVLTAAHCRVTTSDKIIVGRPNLNDTSVGKVVAIKEVRTHARYDDRTHENDMAVVKLAETVETEQLLVFDGNSDLAGTNATVVGWGLTSEGGITSAQLRQVTVPVVTNAVCSAGYASDGITIADTMLCAGLARGGKDSCQGDSGGPIAFKDADNKWKQIGVVSFGIGCARPEKYGVYSRVSKFVSWVNACSR